MFQGLIWFILPIMMVVINDVMAYMFGFFMGRTPLIKLSPKKTWEGFIGGGLATVAITVGLSYFMCQVKQKIKYIPLCILLWVSNYPPPRFDMSKEFS